MCKFPAPAIVRERVTLDVEIAGDLVFDPVTIRPSLLPGQGGAGRDRSIVVWPAAEFRAYAERLNEASRSNPKAQAYQRVLFSGASDEVPDKQGRITVPAALREYAGLDRDVVVVGKNTTAEIWDAQTWSDYLLEQEQLFSDLSEEVLPGL